jgi:hypothetical protein
MYLEIVNYLGYLAKSEETSWLADLDNAPSTQASFVANSISLSSNTFPEHNNRGRDRRFGHSMEESGQHCASSSKPPQPFGQVWSLGWLSSYPPSPVHGRHVHLPPSNGFYHTTCGDHFRGNHDTCTCGQLVPCWVGSASRRFHGSERSSFGSGHQCGQTVDFPSEPVDLSRLEQGSQ